MDPQQIADSLTEAQRSMLVTAKSYNNPSFMPNYHMIEIDCRGRQPDDAAALQELGLVTLPIRIGDRSCTLGFSGELLPLGIEVRRILESR